MNRIYAEHATEPYPVFCRFAPAAPLYNAGHNCTISIVQEIFDKYSAMLLDTSECIDSDQLLYNSSIRGRGAISEQRLSTLCCKFSSRGSNPQPKGPIFLLARTESLSTCSSSTLPSSANSSARSFIKHPVSRWLLPVTFTRVMLPVHCCSSIRRGQITSKCTILHFSTVEW